MALDQHLSKNQTMRQRAVGTVCGLSPSLRYPDQGGLGLSFADVVRLFVLFIRLRDCLFKIDIKKPQGVLPAVF